MSWPTPTTRFGQRLRDCWRRRRRRTGRRGRRVQRRQSAHASIGEATTIDASGIVEVLANATQREPVDPLQIALELGEPPTTVESYPGENKVRYGNQTVAANVGKAATAIAPYLASLLDGAGATTYAHTGSAVKPDGSLVIGGSVNLLTVKNQAEVWIAPQAKINQNTLGKEVTVCASSRLATNNLSGYASSSGRGRSQQCGRDAGRLGADHQLRQCSSGLD